MGRSACGDAPSGSPHWLLSDAMTADVLVRADHVAKKFCRDLKRSLWYGVQDTVWDLLGYDNSDPRLRRGEFWAVNEVSFELRRGECLGLIGRNGSGKSSLLKMLNGLIKPDRGCIEIRGRVGALIALGAGFNPILTGRENVYVNGSILGLTKKEIDDRYDDIIEFADIGEFIDAPVQSYSSGMQVRLGFAIATALKPDILLLDEVLAVGDVAFRAKCYERLGKIISDTSVILVTHNLAQLPRLCDRTLFLSPGCAAQILSVEDGINAYLHATNFNVSPNAVPLVLASHLASASIHAEPQELGTFDKLTIVIELEALAACEIGLIVGNFETADGREGAEFRLMPPSGTGKVTPGRTRLEIDLRELPFASGQYILNLALFDETRKVPLLHFVQAATITVRSSQITNFPNILRASDVRASK
jgi:lipopolysaccharide transport system ATP-binding protein